MSDDVFLKDIKINDKTLSECELFFEHGKHKLFVDRNVDTNSFNAVAVEVAGSVDVDGNLLPVAEYIFIANASFDGVRHLTFNPESKRFLGYLNYPNVKAISALLSKLRELEEEVCEYIECK